MYTIKARDAAHATCRAVLDICIFDDEETKLDEPSHQRKGNINVSISVQLAFLEDLTELRCIFISDLWLLAATLSTTTTTATPSQLVYLQSSHHSIHTVRYNMKMLKFSETPFVHGDSILLKSGA